MSVNTVRTQLLSYLNTMTTLKAVYDWETSNSDGKFPYGTLTLRQGTGEYASTAHNLRMRGFTLRVYQEQTKAGQGPMNAERLCVDVLDELEVLLDQNTTLGGVCKYARPVGWRTMYFDREMDVRVMEINIDVYELVSAT